VDQSSGRRTIWEPLWLASAIIPSTLARFSSGLPRAISIWAKEIVSLIGYLKQQPGPNRVSTPYPESVKKISI